VEASACAPPCVRGAACAWRARGVRVACRPARRKRRAATRVCGVRQRATPPRQLLAGARCGAPRGHRRVCVRGRADQRGACRPARAEACIGVPTSAADPACRGARAAKPCSPASSLAWATCGAPRGHRRVCVGGGGVCVACVWRAHQRSGVRRRACGVQKRATPANSSRANVRCSPWALACVRGVQTSVACEGARAARSCSTRSCSARSCSARRRASACGGVRRAGRKAHRSSSIATLFFHSAFGSTLFK
jgi:hypothetical protein